MDVSPSWGDSISFEIPERDYSVPDTDNIHVYLRIRPRTPSEVLADEPCGQVTPISAKCCELCQGSRTGRYYFDHIFGEFALQEEVFRATVQPLVHSLMQGSSALLFAYGVTNSGKTYTIHGTEGSEGEGLLPRIFRSGFAMLDMLQDPDGREHDIVTEFGNYDNFEVVRRAFDPTAAYSIVISALEIYNEKLVDLLDARGKDLKMVEEGGEMIIKGIQETEVKSFTEAMHHLRVAKGRIQMGQTMCNSDSSRSHSAFTINLCKSAGAYGIMDVLAKLTICDLAGSERASRTENTGVRLKEASTINQSLVVLGRCLQVLRWNQSHPPAQRRVVPFRESKITRLFQSSLQGNGKAVMIVNVSPCTRDVEETMHALQYSSIAKEVVNTPTPVAAKRKMQVGADVQPMNMQKALAEIQSLSGQLNEAQAAIRAKEFEIRQALSKQWSLSLQSLQMAMLQQQEEQEAEAQKCFAEKMRLQELFFRKQVDELVNLKIGLFSPGKQDCTMIDNEENTETWRNGQYRELEHRLSFLNAKLSDECRQHQSVKHELEQCRQALELKEREWQHNEAKRAALLQNMEHSNLQLQCELEMLRNQKADWQRNREDVCRQLRSQNEQLESENMALDIKDKELAGKERELRELRTKLAECEVMLKSEEDTRINQQRTIESLTIANGHASSTIKSHQQVSEQQKLELLQCAMTERKLKEEILALKTTNASLRDLVADMTGKVDDFEAQKSDVIHPYPRKPMVSIGVDTSDLKPLDSRYNSPPSYHATMKEIPRSTTSVRSPRVVNRPQSTLRSTAASNAMSGIFKSPRRGSPTAMRPLAANRPASPGADHSSAVSRNTPLSERLRNVSPFDRPDGRNRSLENRGVFSFSAAGTPVNRSRAGTPCEEVRSPERRGTPDSRRTPPPTRGGSPTPGLRKPSSAIGGTNVRTRARAKVLQAPQDSDSQLEQMDVSGGCSSARRMSGVKRHSDEMIVSQCPADNEDADKRKRRGVVKGKAAGTTRK